jgi:hypothetical protein
MLNTLITRHPIAFLFCFTIFLFCFTICFGILMQTISNVFATEPHSLIDIEIIQKRKN